MPYYHREYKTLTKLRKGETVEVEGISFKALNKTIEPGDFYIAERNTGPKLLVCKRVDDRGYIVPDTMAYPYDTFECIPVEEVL